MLQPAIVVPGHSETAKLVHHGNLKIQQSPIVLVASVASCSIVASGGCLDASSGTWQNLFDHFDTCTSSLLSGSHSQVF